VDAAHALLKAIGIPGYVIVEKDIADLKVYAFPCSFSSNEHLDLALSELLFRKEACSWFIP
jgi:hypothetical protein